VARAHREERGEEGDDDGADGRHPARRVDRAVHALAVSVHQLGNLRRDGVQRVEIEGGDGSRRAARRDDGAAQRRARRERGSGEEDGEHGELFQLRCKGRADGHVSSSEWNGPARPLHGGALPQKRRRSWTP